MITFRPCSFSGNRHNADGVGLGLEIAFRIADRIVLTGWVSRVVYVDILFDA